jgi:hypothetical protein
MCHTCAILVLAFLAFACGGHAGSNSDASAGSGDEPSTSGGNEATGGKVGSGGVGGLSASTGGSAGTGGLGPTTGGVGGALATGGTGAVVSTGGSGGAVEVDPRCPARLPADSAACDADGVRCSYSTATGCLCRYFGSNNCPQVDPDCPTVDADVAAVAPPASDPGGAGKGAPMPLTRTCNCMSARWVCTYSY